MKTAHIITICLMASALSACGAGERLKNIGKAPALTAIDNPTTQKGYRPVQMPMPTVQPAAYSPNSLWQTGSRKFFKDQRANKVGDILTVEVSITDSAKIDNTSSRSRSGSDNVGLSGSVGSVLGSALSGINEIDMSNLANATSTFILGRHRRNRPI